MKKLSVSAKLYLVFALAFLVAEYSRGGDLAIFMAASKALWEGKDIYTTTYYAGFHYLYSPLFAVLIHPLTVLPIAVSGTIWKALSFLMIARAYWVMRRTFQLKEERIQLVLILSFLAVLLPIYSNTHLIQLSAFLLWAILESLDLIFRRNMKVAGAALLALVINIKLLPLAFLAYLIYRGEWRPVGFVFVFSIVFLLLPGLVIGSGYNMELHASWWRMIDPMKPINIIDLDEPGFHGITSWLSSLLTDKFGPHDLDLRRNIMALDDASVAVVINVVRGAVILSALWFLRTVPFKTPRYPFAQFYEVAAICLMIPLVFPHQQVYGFLFLLPATFYLVYFFFHARHGSQHRWKLTALIALGCISFFIVDLEILFGFARVELWHYKTLTYGVLLQFATLALCDPDRVQYPNVKTIELQRSEIDPS